MAEMLKLLRFVEAFARGELVGVLAGVETDTSLGVGTAGATGAGCGTAAK